MDSGKRVWLRRAIIWAVVPILIYGAVALVITLPLISHLDDRIAGTSDSDSYLILRQAWAAREAVLDGHNPLHQNLLAYPDGFTSRLMWATPLRWGPVMLLSFVLPPLVAFNLWLIISVILNGWAAYVLAMELSGRSVAAALLGGLVFATFPTMQGYLAAGQVDMLAMYGLPLFALCVWRVLRCAAGWSSVGWGGIALALASLGLVSQIIYHVMPVALLLGLYHLLAGRDHLRVSQPWLKFWSMLALGIILLMIFFGPLLSEAGRAEVENLQETGRVTLSTDLLAFASPSTVGLLAEGGMVPGYARDVSAANSTEGAAYLGIVALVLVVIGLFARREARPWLVVALGAMFFSLGPLLKWRGEPIILRFEQVESYVTLPWAILQDLAVSEPRRFNGTTALAWGTLVSIGAGAVLRGMTPRPPLAEFERIIAHRVREKPNYREPSITGRSAFFATRKRLALFQAGTVLVLGIMILIEYQLSWPYRTLDAAQPAYFDDLAREDDVRAVLNVPLDQPSAQMNAIAQQIHHGKPMIGGQLYHQTVQNPAMMAVLNRATSGIEPDLLPPMRLQDVRYLLAQVGVDRVVIHRQYFSDAGPVVERLKEIAGSPVYSDSLYAVFAVPQDEALLQDTAVLFAASTGGWSTVVDLDTFAASFLAESGEWYFYTPREQIGEVVFRTQPYQFSRQLGVWLDGRLVAAWWAEDETVRLPLWVGAGFHTLRFEALEGCEPYPYTLTCLSGDCASVNPSACISVAFGRPEWIENEAALTPLDVQLADGLQLRAYDLRVDDTARTIQVRLFWQGERSLPEDYALFVHVADLETAVPLAQSTGFPLIPTSEWGESNWVSDVVVSLPDDLPDGEYALNVGWFQPETNTRIAVQGDRPWAEIGLVQLQTIHLQLAPVTVADQADDLIALLPLPAENVDYLQQVYRDGVALGNDPNSFILIGDSNNEQSKFLQSFGYENYNLGVHTYLQPLIDAYNTTGAFTTDYPSSDHGMTLNTLMDSRFVNPAICPNAANLLDCALQLYKPSVAILYIGTYDTCHSPFEVYQENFNRAMQLLTERGVIAILTTYTVYMQDACWENTPAYTAVISEMAAAYRMPLIDLPLYIQSLPDGGMESDGWHLSYPSDYYTDFVAGETLYGSTKRELLTLQMLYLLRRDVMGLSP